MAAAIIQTYKPSAYTWVGGYPSTRFAKPEQQGTHINQTLSLEQSTFAQNLAPHKAKSRVCFLNRESILKPGRATM